MLENYLLQETDHEQQQKIRGFIPDVTDIMQDETPKLRSQLFFQNKDIYMSKHSRYADYPEHSHHFLELNYIYKGCCQQRINDKDILLEEGDILLMDTDSRHAIKALGQEDILINILFQNTDVSLNWLNNLRGEDSLLYKLLLSSSSQQFAHDNYLIIPAKSNQHIQSILHQMMTEYFLPQIFSENIIRRYLPILFYELARTLPSIEHQASVILEETPYLQALKSIDKEFTSLTLQELADRMAFNKNYLSNLIKEKSGLTFTQLITQRKLMKAQHLLQSTAMPIQEIALTVGFSNKTYFYAKYKEYFGYGPRDERK